MKESSLLTLQLPFPRHLLESRTNVRENVEDVGGRGCTARASSGEGATEGGSRIEEVASKTRSGTTTKEGHLGETVESLDQGREDVVGGEVDIECLVGF